MKPKQAQLEQRRRHLRAKIAAQRLLLEQRLEVLQGPALALDRARAVGAMLRQHAPALAVAGSIVLFLARGRFVSSTIRAVRLGRRAMKLLTAWKIAAAFLRRRPRPHWDRKAPA